MEIVDILYGYTWIFAIGFKMLQSFIEILNHIGVIKQSRKASVDYFGCHVTIGSNMGQQ